MKRLAAVMFAACALVARAAQPPASPALSFRIDEGHNLNHFLRDGDVAAHLLLRAGTEPRILVAFPAGNGGVGVWFDRTAAPVNWKLMQPPVASRAIDSRGRELRGIEFIAEVDAKELRVAASVLSSVRVLRDFELLRKAPEEVLTPMREIDGGIGWERDRLDGAAGYRLTIDVAAGILTKDGVMRPNARQPLWLRVRALTGEPPLHALDSLLTSQAGSDERARNALAFLSYREKFMAGSWRFDTYFGRDTLISALLLAPVLEPVAVESAIGSVLDRLALDGEVAHEEDIGEFAVLRNAREGRGRIDTPIYDYGMVDDDFLLAPLAAHWLLDDARGVARAREYLAGTGANAGKRGHQLARNLAWVAGRAAPFAQAPKPGNLVAIKDGRNTGNWRDSEQGLGMGRYAFDVNAALVPAALEAAARLTESGLLGAYLDEDQRRALAGARAAAKVWSAKAPALFAVNIRAAEAGAAISSYAREAGVSDDAALRALGKGPLTLHALSLDGEGRAVPILNSDEGFRLLLTQPPAKELAQIIPALLRPFPAGLMTDAGMLVANPALARPELRKEFSRYAYHGTVVWSWQQALMIAGLDRQLQRKDLPSAVRKQLAQGRAQLWAAIDAARELRTSELWSWSYADRRYRAEPFGRPGADVDESNAAQLWSTVFLGLRRDSAPGN